MAYELRRPNFDLSGSLAAPLAPDGQVITGKGNLFTSLPTDYSTGLYIPLTLANDGLGKSEIVWGTSHSGASPSLGIVRGCEGTTPLAFDQGDIIRCGPTLRDVVSGVASRSTLPSNPHIGMRVLLLDEQVVLERTSTGWDDSASLKADPKRRHHWALSGAPLSSNSLVTIAGWAPASNHTGTLATLQGNSQFLLNQPGDWRLKIAMFGASANNRNQGPSMDWPSGAFLSKPFQITGVFGGISPAGSGNGLIETVWEGYVTATQAAQPITCQAFSTLALTGCQYDFSAEYMGQ